MPNARHPRTAVLSLREYSHRVWTASQYEFEDVVAGVDDVRLVAPVGRSVGPAAEALSGAANRVRRAVGRPRRRPVEPVDDAWDAELFFAVFAAPHEIGVLPAARRQVARSAVKVAFIVELWVPQLPSVRDYLLQLRGFDHIFLFNRDAIPLVQQITGVPCSYLPTAVDVDRFAPVVPGGPRMIDVTSYGRRLAGTHEALRHEMAAGRLHYHYDTVRGAFDVSDHVEHREVLATTLQHSRYAVVYKNNDEPERVARTGGEESLTNRFFEVLSAGAVMLGSAPDVPDFAACFDWPDAIVPVPAPAPRIADVIAELDAQPERVAAASLAGITGSLRRHDWAHRWQEVLTTVGLPALPALTDRLEHLERRAQVHEEAAPDGAPQGSGAASPESTQVLPSAVNRSLSG